MHANTQTNASKSFHGIPGSNQKAEKKYSVHLKEIKSTRAAIPAAWTAPNSPPLQREPTLPSSDCDFPSIHYHLTQKYTTSFTFNTNPRDSPLRTETATQFTYDWISTRHLINQSRKTDYNAEKEANSSIKNSLSSHPGIRYKMSNRDQNTTHVVLDSIHPNVSEPLDSRLIASVGGFPTFKKSVIFLKKMHLFEGWWAQSSRSHCLIILYCSAYSGHLQTCFRRCCVFSEIHLWKTNGLRCNK